MKPLTRRSVTTGLAAAVTAIPVVVGPCKGAIVGPGNDPLVEAIGRYRAVIVAANASHGLTDEELDAWIDGG